jgi:hypothetical protein
MKSAANPRDVPYQPLIKVWLQGNLQDSSFLSAPFAIHRRHPQVLETTDSLLRHIFGFLPSGKTFRREFRR